MPDPLLTNDELRRLDESLWRKYGIGAYARTITREIEDIIAERSPTPAPVNVTVSVSATVSDEYLNVCPEVRDHTERRMSRELCEIAHPYVKHEWTDGVEPHTRILRSSMVVQVPENKGE